MFPLKIVVRYISRLSVMKSPVVEKSVRSAPSVVGSFESFRCGDALRESILRFHQFHHWFPWFPVQRTCGISANVEFKD